MWRGHEFSTDQTFISVCPSLTGVCSDANWVCASCWRPPKSRLLDQSKIKWHAWPHFSVERKIMPWPETTVVMLSFVSGVYVFSLQVSSPTRRLINILNDCKVGIAWIFNRFFPPLFSIWWTARVTSIFYSFSQIYGYFRYKFRLLGNIFSSWSHLGNFRHSFLMNHSKWGSLFTGWASTYQTLFAFRIYTESHLFQSWYGSNHSVRMYLNLAQTPVYDGSQ